MTISPELEKLSAEIHSIYMLEAKRQGDVRHQDNYEDLPENIKEFDRVLARRMLEREALAEKRGEENKIRNVWEFGEKQGWDNQVMTDIRNFLSYGVDLTQTSNTEL